MYSKGVTELEESCPALRGPSSKIVVIGKSVTMFNQAVSESFVARQNNMISFSFQETPH